MKALSLWQPWASAIGPKPGQKRLETRSWQTPYRGWLAIHAAKRWTAEQRRSLVPVTAEAEAMYTAVALNHWIPSVYLPLGMVVAVARLTGCLPTEFNRPPAPECYLGDYTPGRYAWVLTDIHVLPDPIPAHGAQGLFDLPPDVVQRIGEMVPETLEVAA